MFTKLYPHGLYAIGLVVLILFLVGLSAPVSAAPSQQLTPFPTPTPGPDGRIIYVVKENDTLWRVSAITGVPLDQLRELNNLGTEQPIVPGQELLLGYGGPSEVTPTAGPSPTPEPSIPAPSPQPGAGTLCVLVFNDHNGDSLRQEEELSIPGGQISISNRSGDVSLTVETTTSVEPQCFEELPEGDYNITVAIPDDYNPTTVLNYALKLEPGSETHIDFGAQVSSEVAVESQTSSGDSRSPMIGIVGVLFLLVGIGLGIFAGRLGGKREKPVRDSNNEF